MVVIGFDPGSLRFGVGIIEKASNRMNVLYSETIRLKGDDFSTRMAALWNRLGQIHDSFTIDFAAFEEGFLGKNVRSLTLISKTVGLVMGFLISRGIGMRSYSPREVKVAVTGNGNASKHQVNRMVKILLNLKGERLATDESDALAVAYCHLSHLK
jgi:crossover junction endodeoxyribonuclease RuvC